MKVPLKDVLESEDLVDAKTLVRAERRLIASLRDEPHRRSRMLLAAAAALVLTAGAAAWLTLRRPAPQMAQTPIPESSSALTLASGARFEGAVSHDAAERVEFADTSWAELAPQTELDSDLNDGDQMAMTLQRGAVTFQVQPGGSRVWTVDLEALVVRVTGTRFTVERDAHRVAVAVTRGSVEIRGPIVAEGVRSLGAGDRVELDLEPNRAPEPPPLEPVDPIQEVANEPPAGDPESRWKELAQQGEHDGAYQLLGQVGLRHETRQARSAPELLRLADVARLSGHPADAEAPLRRLIEDFPADERRPMARFTLARLLQERLRRPRDAAALYQRMLSDDVPAGLREPTMARLIDAWVAAGDTEQARSAACDYTRAFPSGPNRRRAEARCR